MSLSLQSSAVITPSQSASVARVVLVLSFLGWRFDAGYVWITLAALAVYITFTVAVTEWRTQFRREANEFDSAAHTRAIDSLLNYETVKYFNNEAFESQRYDESLQRLRRARLKSQTSLSLLNTGQQLIISVALVAMLWRATQGAIDGRMTLGDLVMINAFMIQLYIPLNHLGMVYREIKQSLADMEAMFDLLDVPETVADAPDARPRCGGTRSIERVVRCPLHLWRKTSSPSGGLLVTMSLRFLFRRNNNSILS